MDLYNVVLKSPGNPALVLREPVFARTEERACEIAVAKAREHGVTSDLVVSSCEVMPAVRVKATFSAQVNRRRIDLIYTASGRDRREAIERARASAQQDNPGISMSFRGAVDA